MHRHSGYALGALLAAGVLAGCAGETTALLHAAAAAAPQSVAALPPLTAVRSVPQPASAWYQVQFEGSKIDIDPRGRMVVDSVAKVVLNSALTYVAVIGKTDRVGSASANLVLAQRRADNVRDALLAAGVPSARIETRWTGEGKQDIATSQKSGEARSRVVDIEVVDETR